MGRFLAQLLRTLIPTLIGALLLSAGFVYWLAAVTGRVGVGGVVFLVGLPLLIVAAGRVATRWLGLFPNAGFRLPLDLLLGFVVVTPCVFILDAFTPLPSIGCWLMVAAGTAAAGVASRPREVGEASPERPGWAAAWGLFAVALALVAATLWTQELRPYKLASEQAVVYRPWSDLFVHAQMTGLLASNRPMASLGNPDLAGEPLPIYHYGSYVYPAGLSAFAGVSAFDAAAAFWVPLGLLLMGLAAYALAAEWKGDAAGLAALAAVLLLPDAPAYGIPLKWYGFFWLLTVAPAALYGIAGGAAALLLVTRSAAAARPASNRRLLWAGLAVAASTLLLKAQIFIVVLPLVVLWSVWFANRWTVARRAMITVGLFAAGVGGLLVQERLGIGPRLLPSLSDLGHRWYFGAITTNISPGIWRDALSPPHGPIVVKLLVILIEVLVGPLGLLIILVAGLLTVRAIRRTLTPLDAVPALAVALHLGVSILPGSNVRGAIDEVWHRPFVWVVFLVLAWSAAQLGPLLDTRRNRLLLGLVAVCLIVVPLRLGGNIESALTVNSNLTYVSLPRGLVDCADFLRTHTAESAVVQDVPKMDFPVLASLAERRAFLGRDLSFWQVYYPASTAEAEATARQNTLRRLLTAKTAPDVQALLEQTGINWLVFGPGERPDWPAEVFGRPLYESHGYAVFRGRPAAGSGG